jgi:hypothetical protein
MIWEWTGAPYRYQGCYDDNNGPYLGTTWGGTLPRALNNYPGGVGLDECAAAARSQGFPLFSLQKYGQCSLGYIADVARLASEKLPDESCSALPCATSGADCPAYVNKVFFLVGAHTPSENPPTQ